MITRDTFVNRATSATLGPISLRLLPEAECFIRVGSAMFGAYFNPGGGTTNPLEGGADMCRGFQASRRSLVH